MANVGQVYYKVIDPSTGEYISNISSIYEGTNIVSAYGATQFNKLGIQAPPGTQVVLNNTKNIMLGRTGMYELDEDISITNLYFVRPRNYVLDQEATDADLLNGANGIITAENVRADGIAAITSPIGSAEYLAAYNEIQAEYETSYNDALSMYNRGLNGIYIIDDENPQELFGIIVDFIYV